MTNKTRGYARGYSVYMVDQVGSADSAHLGVQLAKICIDKGIPAAEVARTLGVSKQAVYAWFVGRFQPNVTLTPKVEALIEQYRSGTAV